MTTSFLRRRHRHDLLGVLALALFIAFGSQLIAKSYYLTVLTYAGIYAIGALGMCLLFGFAGQISIGQAAFFGLGAYVSAFAVMRAGLPPLAGIILSVVVSGAFGWAVSRPLLRLTTNYLAMATLAFGVICYVVFSQAVSLTGGLDPGIYGMPSLSIFGIEATNSRWRFIMVGAFLVLAMLTTVNLAHSRFGRALRALNGSEVAAAGLGVDVVRAKVAAFSIAAAMAGLAGALFGFVQGSFSASTFGVSLSIELLIMVVVGSLTSPWGALSGALFISIIPIFLEGLDSLKLLIYGVILTSVVVFMPDGFARGVIDLGRAGWRRARGR